MKRFALAALALFALSSVGAAQYVSSQSYKRGAATTQSITSAAAGAAVDVQTYSYALVRYSGTYTTNTTSAGLQASYDGGTTWDSVPFFFVDSATPCRWVTVTGDLTDNSTNLLLLPIYGATHIRTNALNWGSGTISVRIVPFSSPGSPCAVVNLNQALDAITVGDSVRLGDSAGTVATATTTPGGSDRGLVVRNIPSGTQTVDSEFGAAAAAADGAANPTAPFVLSAVNLFNGTTWDRARGDTTNGLDVDVTRVPTDPFGANADAASATGSISAKLRFIAITGIPITSFPDNEPLNISQINGVTPLMGNGATGTGSHRTTLANDNSAIANWGHGASGSAVPSGATMMGVRSGANMVRAVQADSSAAINVSTATTAQLIALASGQVIHLTSFDFLAGGTTNVTLVYGTGTNCGTGQASLTGAYPLTAQVGMSKGNGQGPILVVPAGNALCVTSSAAVQVSGSVSYTQFTP